MATGPFKPVVAYGKSVEDTADAAVGIGQSTFTANAHNYVVGNRIIVSENDGTEIQHLGLVTTKDTNTFTTEWETNSDKDGSGVAKFWKPTTFVAFQFDSQGSGPITFLPMTASDWTRGGTPWAVNFGDGGNEILYNWLVATSSDHTDFLTFIQGRNNGAKFFTLFYYDHYRSLSKAAKVLWRAENLTADMKNGQGHLTAWSLAFMFHSDDAYVES